jgi:hypothetical protein
MAGKDSRPGIVPPRCNWMRSLATSLELRKYRLKPDRSEYLVIFSAHSWLSWPKPWLVGSSATVLSVSRPYLEYPISHMFRMSSQRMLAWLASVSAAL